VRLIVIIILACGSVFAETTLLNQGDSTTTQSPPPSTSVAYISPVPIMFFSMSWKNISTGMNVLPFNYAPIYGVNFEIQMDPPYSPENSILQKNNTYQMTFSNYMMNQTIANATSSSVITGIRCSFQSLLENDTAVVKAELYELNSTNYSFQEYVPANSNQVYSYTDSLWANMEGTVLFTPQESDVRISELYLFYQNTTTLRETTLLAIAPEPSALSLLAVGLGGLAMLRRRRS